MKRLTFRTGMGDDLLDAIAFLNPDDAEGLYNLRDIGKHGSDELLLEIANRLAEYEDAEEQGLLVWLPCKYEPMQIPPDKFDSGDSRLMEWLRKNGISVEVTDA